MSPSSKILIIDEKPEMVSEVLPTYGYEIDIAPNGMEGIKKLNENHYDLIVMDLILPVMDGWETLKFIRTNSKNKTIPIIILTSVDNEAKIVFSLKYGTDDYILKPCFIPNLLARIEALLRRENWAKENSKLKLVKGAVKKPIKNLTKRETEVLQCVIKGDSNDKIAEKLLLRSTTVKTHLNNIYKKLNAESRVQATLIAIQNNLVD